MKRPCSIAEIASRILQTQRPANQTVLGNMPFFANDFRHHIVASGFDPEMVQEQPANTGCRFADVWLAGLAEYLCHKYNSPCPTWAQQPHYFLSEPLRLGGPNFQHLAQSETPEAWLKRQLFCGASAF